MLSGVVEGGVAILLGIAGAVYIFGQVKENAKRNEIDIQTIKHMIKEYQENMQNTLAKAMEDMKEMLNAQKEHQREALEREITHLKDIVSMSSAETREDIKRLDQKQSESNKLKERMVLAEASLKSLHHRLDIEPPVLIRDEE